MNVERIKLEPIQKVEAAPARKLRVCAYARVSTETEEQKTSFDYQVRYYTKLIADKPEWEFAGIYADYGITGTSADKRPEFLRMVKDCEEGRIDLVLTKSISRFARNTLQCLTYVRHLNSLGVHIIFESNGVDTRTAFSEMLLTVLAAFAQEESRSISENTIWGIRKRFESGVNRWCRLYGYEQNENGRYQIIPDQAAVVQKIFDLYEHGTAIDGICAYLDELGARPPLGGSRWAHTSVNSILCNERYAGDILLQKTITENHITHKAIRNDSTVVPSYYIENHHTPIIPKKQFERCRRIREMRRPQRYTLATVKGRSTQYPIGDRLRCPYCGSVLYQRSIRSVLHNTSGWCCDDGEAACKGFIIRSDLVKGALLEAYKRLDTKKVAEKVSSPRFGKAAELTLKIKAENPKMDSVEYWWVDELIDHVEFGAHSHTGREFARLAALGEAVTDDRTVKVYWNCGLITTVSSGIFDERDHPAFVAERYWKRIDERKETAE